jgi:cobalt-zinc-cadmium efflux system outer membrane protein
VTEERLAATELRLARARSVPSLTLGAGVKRFERTDDAALVFGASIPLPVFDRNQGNVTAAELRSGRASYWREAERVRLRAVLYGMCQEILHAAEEIRVLEEEVLAGAGAALVLAERGYEMGRFSQLDLLEAQRTLLELRRERIDAGMTRHTLVLEIERLLGVSLAGAERNQQP